MEYYERKIRNTVAEAFDRLLEMDAEHHENLEILKTGQNPYAVGEEYEDFKTKIKTLTETTVKTLLKYQRK